MMRFLGIWLVLLCALCNGVSVYMDPAGAAGNCSVSAPCATLEQVLSTFANSSQSNDEVLTITIGSGSYGCVGNSEINLPANPVEMFGNQSGSVPVFNCSEANTFLYTTKNFSMNYISIVSYAIGIQTTNFSGEGFYLSRTTFQTTQSAFLFDNQQTSTQISIEQVSVTGADSRVTSSMASDCFISESSFSHASNSSALYLSGNAVFFDIQQSNFTHSHAEGGGAIKAVNTTLSISGCLFQSNSAVQGVSLGGGLYAEGCFVTFSQNLWSDCQAGSGGAVYLLNTIATDDQSDFNACSASVSGAGMFIDNTELQNLTITLNQTSFVSNVAPRGAAVACCSTNSSNCMVQIDNLDLTLVNNTDTEGQDGISCSLINNSTPPPPPADQSPSNDDNDEDPDDNGWLFYTILFVMVAGFVFLVFGALACCYGYRKHQRQYSTID